MIDVLVVDDSATARRLTCEILASDAAIRVVGEANDGLEAVPLTQKLRPNLVVMDLHMPGMDGLAATREIMITVPTPIVIATGSVATREVELAMQALRAGALTVIRKPSGPEQPDFEERASEFVRTVKAMAEVKVVRQWRPGARNERPKSPAGPTRQNPVVAIATSTGGPAALHRVLSQLSGSLPASVLVVQHISPGFVLGLANWLNLSSNLRVHVAEAGRTLQPHEVYIAPDDRHLGVTREGAILLSHDPPINGFRPSGTYLFESVAKAFGPSTIAVVLTGMGDDGVKGLSAVRHAGGKVIGQDRESSVVFGMPGAAAAANLVDFTLPLDAIPNRIESLVADLVS